MERFLSGRVTLEAMRLRRLLMSATLGWRRRYFWRSSRGMALGLLLLGVGLIYLWAWPIYLWAWPSPFDHALPFIRNAFDQDLIRLPWARGHANHLAGSLSHDCCMTSLLNFGSYIMVLQGVALDPAAATGNRGGEDLSSVMGQEENSEFIHPKPGFFTLHCACVKPAAPYFYSQTHFQEWYDAVVFDKSPDTSACANIPNRHDKSVGRQGRSAGSFQESVSRLDNQGSVAVEKQLVYGQGSDVNIHDPPANVNAEGVVDMVVKDEDAGSRGRGVVTCLEAELAVAVVRHDYANLYWTIIELHAVYVTARLLGAGPVTLLIADAHPQGKLDPLWQLLFKKVVRVGELRQKIHIPVLAWSIPTMISPIVMREKPLPYFTDFRKDMRHAVGAPMTSRDCDRLVIRLLERRDYVAHARNPSGRVKRKLGNSQEILKELKRAFPRDNVTSYQPELDPVDEQIKKMTVTDILIGVHGAGLGHVVFMRKGSGLVELFPTYYRFIGNLHFQELAGWSGIRYVSWYNLDVFFRDNVTINIDPAVVVRLVLMMRALMCDAQ